MAGGGNSHQRKVQETRLRKLLGKAYGALVVKKDPPAASGRPIIVISGYFRAIGFSALLFGVGVLLMPVFFWSGIWFINAAFLVLFLDLVLERSLRVWVRTVGALILAAGCFAFNDLIAFAPAPLSVTLTDLAGGNPDTEGRIGGIRWKPEYYEVNIGIVPLASAYRDLDIQISTDADASIYIGEIGKTTNQYIEKESAIEGAHLIKTEANKVTASTSVAGLTTSWTVHCEKLRGGDLLELVVAFIGVTTENTKVRKKPEWLDISADYTARFNKPVHMEKRYEVKPPPQPL